MSLFDHASLQAVVAKTLESSPKIPPGARGAFVLVANEEGVRAVTALKIANSWRVESSVGYEWGSDDVEFGVSIRGTF